MCDTWQAMCVTHGMSCVNMHGSFEAYIRGFTWVVGEARRAQFQFVGGAARRRRRKGKEKEKERRREREERKGEREEHKRKGKKKREEERGG